MLLVVKVWRTQRKWNEYKFTLQLFLLLWVFQITISKHQGESSAHLNHIRVVVKKFWKALEISKHLQIKPQTICRTRRRKSQKDVFVVWVNSPPLVYLFIWHGHSSQFGACNMRPCTNTRCSFTAPVHAGLCLAFFKGAQSFLEAPILRFQNRLCHTFNI